MITITLHLPNEAPLAALKEFARAIDCTLHHTVGHGYEMRRRCQFSETGLLAVIGSDLCAAWAEGGSHALTYLEEARRLAVLTSDFEAAEDLNLLRLLFINTKVDLPLLRSVA